MGSLFVRATAARRPRSYRASARWGGARVGRVTAPNPFRGDRTAAKGGEPGTGASALSAVGARLDLIGRRVSLLGLRSAEELGTHAALPLDAVDSRAFELEGGGQPPLAA